MTKHRTIYTSRLRLPVAVAAVLVLLAASCSGGAGDENVANLDQESAGPFELVTVVDALFGLFEGEPSAPSVAVLVALDRGYELRTVVAAAFSGRIDLDGILTDDSGTALAPKGSDHFVVSDKALLVPNGEASPELTRLILIGTHQSGTVTMAGLQQSLEDGLENADLGFGAGAAPATETEPDVWRSSEDRTNRLQLAAILALASSGYSIEQIVFALVAGDSISCISSGSFQCIIVDGDEPEVAALEDLFIRDVAESEAQPANSNEQEQAQDSGDADGWAEGVYSGSFPFDLTVGLDLGAMGNRIEVDVVDGSVFFSWEVDILMFWGLEPTCLATWTTYFVAEGPSAGPEVGLATMGQSQNYTTDGHEPNCSGFEGHAATCHCAVL